MAVKLKSYFGIHPAIIYFIKVFVIFLAVGIIPSFFTNTRRVYINTNIYPVNIKVDDKPLSITPYNLRLRAGVHNVEFYYAGRKLKEAKFKVKNALFFSWFFEYSQKLDYEIKRDEAFLFEIEKDFLKNAALYSTLFYTDSTHIQMPYFSHYKSLAKEDVKDELVSLASFFIANKDAAIDYKKTFNNNYEFEQKGEYIIDNRIPGAFKSKFSIFDIGGVEFVKVSDNLAVSRGEIKDAENILSAFEYAKSFSNKNKVKSRLLNSLEYKSLVISDKDGVFSDLTTGLWEYTSDIFLPDGSVLDKKSIEILDSYGVQANYRLFCFSSLNSYISDTQRLSLVGCVGARDTNPRCAFRLAVDL